VASRNTLAIASLPLSLLLLLAPAFPSSRDPRAATADESRELYGFDAAQFCASPELVIGASAGTWSARRITETCKRLHAAPLP
jgi:hypothetical protein